MQSISTIGLDIAKSVFQVHGVDDVPRGTMDEASSYVRLDLLSARRQGRPKDCSASSSNPMMEGPWCRFRREARARERHRHCGEDSLNALDPNRPIREADVVTLLPAYLMSDFKGRRFQCRILLDRRAADRRPPDITSEC